MKTSKERPLSLVPQSSPLRVLSLMVERLRPWLLPSAKGERSLIQYVREGAKKARAGNLG